MIFLSITMRDHFIPICIWKEEIKACNHLSGLPLPLQNIFLFIYLYLKNIGGRLLRMFTQWSSSPRSLKYLCDFL